MFLKIETTESHQNKIVLETRPTYSFLGMLKFLGYRLQESKKEKKIVKRHIIAKK